MRHGDKVNNLSRTASHRKALLINLSCQLFEYKRIVTTLAKAKALRTYAEPLISKAKENTTHQRRIVFSRLQNKEAVKELFDVISPKVGNRPGGYTRIIKLGKRVGDNAELAMIELVDYNEIYGKVIGEAEKATRRTRRSGRGKKSSVETADETPVTDVKKVKTESKEDTEASPVETEAKEEKDDLTRIEGIGPKGAEALVAAGMATFAQVAKATAEEIKAVLDNSGGNFNAQDTATWPEQAQLAADGKWDELKAFQEKLNAGRE